MRRLSIPARQSGFSMIELMVGICLALIATVIILQTFGNFEGVRRTLGSGASAQENGAYGLLTLERDIRMSGWGMINPTLAGCASTFTYYDSGSGGAAMSNSNLMPVSIVSGAAGSSDSITINWGNALRGNVVATLSQSMASPSDVLAINEAAGFNVNDLVWVAGAGNCTLMQLNQVQAASLQLNHDNGTAPTYNPPSSYTATNSWPTYQSGAQVFDMGQVTHRTYSVINNPVTPVVSPGIPTLQSQDGTANPIAIASNIVALKAQYGISSAAGNQSVAQWVNATGTWAAPTMSMAAQIKAVRIAVVARSQLLEKPGPNGCAITTAAPATWSGNNPDGTSYTPPAIVLSNDPNWQCYRYRTFLTVVPLRNVLWANT